VGDAGRQRRHRCGLRRPGSVLIPFLAANDSADGELVTAHDPATHTIEGQPSTLIVP
jgi:hypothetical protein